MQSLNPGNNACYTPTLAHPRILPRMRKLFIALGIFAVLLLLPLLLMRSERSLLVLAHWAVDSFTDLRLVVQKPVFRPLKGLVSADEIHLYPKADDGPPFVSVLGLRGDINAADIYRRDLSHSRLSAEQVVIYVSSGDQTADPTPVQWLRHLSWLPETLQVGQLHVVTNTNKTLI